MKVQLMTPSLLLELAKNINAGSVEVVNSTAWAKNLMANCDR